MDETIDKGQRVMTLVYQSTRDANNTVSASQAILQGLATDGGLFTPLTYPKVDLTLQIERCILSGSC